MKYRILISQSVITQKNIHHNIKKLYGLRKVFYRWFYIDIIQIQFTYIIIKHESKMIGQS